MESDTIVSCFCFGFKRKGSANNIRKRDAKRMPPKLPPEVTKKISAAVATTIGDSAYSLAKKGKAEELKRLLETANEEHVFRWLSWMDDSNRTPLIIAAKEGHTECVKILIDRGANVLHMSHGRDEGSALHIAVRKKLSPRIIYALLAKGANPFIENNFHTTAWDLARQHSNWNAISIFNDLGLFRKTLPIQIGGGPCDTSMREVCILPRYEWQCTGDQLHRIGRTLYICSVDSSEDHSYVDLTGAQAEWFPEETQDIASILLTFPASRARLAKDLAANVQISSAVMHIWMPRWAAWTLRDFVEIINQDDEVRVGHQLRGSTSDDVDSRVMNWIRQQTAVQCTEDSLESTPNETQLPDEVCRRATAGEHDELNSLLKSLSKFDKIRALSWEDINGNTPLMNATENGHTECVNLLLEHGANVYHTNRQKNKGTALHLAIANQLPNEIVGALLEHHSNPLVENSNRVTAVDLSGGDRKLMTSEKLLFQEVMKGSLTIQGTQTTLGTETDLLVFIAPRYACCDRLQDLRRISKTMHIYESGQDEPMLEMDLYEARAELQQKSERNSVLLTLPTDSVLTSHWAEMTKSAGSSLFEICLSFSSTDNKCSRLVKIINIEDGLSTSASVKNIWKENRRIRDSASVLFSARQEMSSFSLSSAPSIESDVLKAEIDEQTDSSAQINTNPSDS